MSVSEKLDEIRKMSVDERLELVQAIWDSIAEEDGQPELSEAQRQELARRLADHEANPDAVVSWEQIKADALARARR